MAEPWRWPQGARTGQCFRCRCREAPAAASSPAALGRESGGPGCCGATNVGRLSRGLRTRAYSSPWRGDENITHPPHPTEPTTMGDSTFSSALAHGATRDADLAASLLRRVFRRLPFSVVVRLWNGSFLAVGGNEVQPADARFSLGFRNPQAVSAQGCWRDWRREKSPRRSIPRSCRSGPSACG